MAPTIPPSRCRSMALPAATALVGTAVSNTNGSITYTAPAVVPTPSNIVQLTITSVDNPAVSITQNISVMNPIPILTSATPMAFNPGPATIVLTGQKFITGAQVLVNGAPVTTTFNSGTQLTATVDSDAAGQSRSSGAQSQPRPGHLGRSHRHCQRHASRSSRQLRRTPRVSLSRPPSAPPTPTSAHLSLDWLPGLAQPAIRHCSPRPPSPRLNRR